MAADLERQLRRLGLSKAEVAAYTHLLHSGPAPVADLARDLDRTQEEADSSVERLIRLGLIGHSGADGSVTPISPIAALDLLARRRESEVREAQVSAMQAYENFRRTVWPHQTHGLIEVITGSEMWERIRSLESNATTEILRMDTPPYFAPANPNQMELDNLARGVAYRVVYARSAVERQGYYEENIRPCIAAGEQARTLPSLPVKLTIFDQRVAIVALAITEAEVNPSLVVVNPSSLLSSLSGLFELTWRAALPMHVGDRHPSPLRPVERQVLELLAIGLADEVIAERVGVSRRTLTRHIERLMTRAGVASRFQLGLFASRNHWI